MQGTPSSAPAWRVRLFDESLKKRARPPIRPSLIWRPTLRIHQAPGDGHYFVAAAFVLEEVIWGLLVDPESVLDHRKEFAEQGLRRQRDGGRSIKGDLQPVVETAGGIHSVSLLSLEELNSKTRLAIVAQRGHRWFVCAEAALARVREG